ncbi:MAG: hypothetical protein IPN34_18480 [Planctomycetes bacterium]|nr:hypothetical protein [Planctomycetota bacterium]
MIVPAHWAEASRQHRASGKQITVRRFGWSEHSPAEAQAMAEARAGDALARAIAGEKLPRRERKVPYNGAEGVPIREEILANVGDAVITRNSYGARCLNTPYVFFADIDHPEGASLRTHLGSFLLVLVAGAIAAWFFGHQIFGVILTLIGLSGTARAVDFFWRRRVRSHGGLEGLALERVERCVRRDPSLGLRVYRTPRGLRVLATNRSFDPLEPAVQELFRALEVDPLYARMCTRQRCFRARLSAKPWRIGISEHLKPRPGVWPVRPEQRPRRERWVAEYERRARDFAACFHVATYGNPEFDPRVRPVVELHDAECRALEVGMPLA